MKEGASEASERWSVVGLAKQVRGAGRSNEWGWAASDNNIAKRKRPETFAHSRTTCSIFPRSLQVDIPPRIGIVFAIPSGLMTSPCSPECDNELKREMEEVSCANE